MLGINIGPNKDSDNRINDYLIGIEKFYEVADYITVNISSPNTENLRNFHDEGKLQDLLKTISEKKKNLKTNIPFFEDIARNLKPAYELGMKTVWIENNEPWAAKYSDEEFVNYKTGSLTNFLKEINEHR